jgi:hypothetical protein
MRIAYVCVTVAAMVAATAAEGRGRDIETSWGKPGVSLVQYRLDAGVCAAKAMSLDVADTPAARQMVKASQALETALTSTRMITTSHPGGVWFVPGADTNHIRDSFGVDKAMNQIKAIQMQSLRSCLAERGYREFRLTTEQRQRLRKLPVGSSKRRAFLYELARDPAIIGTQTL